MRITKKLGLSLIEPGQQQKELSHNEAIERLDMLVQPVVLSGDLSIPPANPATGDCYVVKAAASGEWTGRDGQVAMMGSGGWVYLVPFEGLEVRDLAGGRSLRFDGDGWLPAVHRGGVEDENGAPLLTLRQPAIALPAGGTTQDSEARDAIVALVERLEAHGLIQPN